MEDLLAAVVGWGVAGGCWSTRVGPAQWQSHGPVRGVAIQRRQTPPDGAGVGKSSIKLRAAYWSIDRKSTRFWNFFGSFLARPENEGIGAVGLRSVEAIA